MITAPPIIAELASCRSCNVVDYGTTVIDPRSQLLDGGRYGVLYDELVLDVFGQ